MRKKCAYLFCTLFNNFVFVACTSIWLDRQKERRRRRRRQRNRDTQDATPYASRHVEATSKRVIIFKLCKAALNADVEREPIVACLAPEMTVAKWKRTRVCGREWKKENALERGRAWHEQCTHALTRWQGCMWHLGDLATTHHKYEKGTLQINKMQKVQIKFWNYCLLILKKI